MFSEEVLKKAGDSSGPFPVKLDSDDSMFSVMRDLNFRAVGVFLSDKAREISAQFEVSWSQKRGTWERESVCVSLFLQARHDAKTVTQLKTFVEKLPHMQEAKFNLSKRRSR